MSKGVINKKVTLFIWIFTAAVFALVIVLHELPKAAHQPSFVKHLSLMNAMINGTTFLLLLTSLWAIKSKKIELHKKINTTAVVLSVVFLLSYLINHYFIGDTIYGGSYRGLYLFVLISHIVLAGISLPFILLSYYFGYLGIVNRHKKLVRFTYPVWLYVAFSGVLIYLFLAPYYA